MPEVHDTTEEAQVLLEWCSESASLSAQVARALREPHDKEHPPSKEILEEANELLRVLLLEDRPTRTDVTTGLQNLHDMSIMVFLMPIREQLIKAEFDTDQLSNASVELGNLLQGAYSAEVGNKIASVFSDLLDFLVSYAGNLVSRLHDPPPPMTHPAPGAAA